MTIRKLWLLAGLTSIASHAHPGHEPFSEGTKHFLVSPNHSLPIIIFALGIFLAAHFLPRRAERLFTRALAVTILTTALFS